MLLSVNLLANLILQNYYTNSKCLFVFSDNNNFIYNQMLPSVQINVVNSTFDPDIVFQYYGCQGILINVATPVSTIVYLEDKIRKAMDRLNFRRYLILPHDSPREDAMAIFAEKAVEYIADLVVMIPVNFGEEDVWFGTQEVDFQLFTHKFVGLEGNNDTVLLDEWFASNQSFLYENDLYPDKISDGEGRIWKIATFSYKPYSVPATHEGTELEISLEFCKKYNLTPYLLVDEEGEWGEIYDNWTGYGILGNVMNDYGDVGLAALYTWGHEYGFLDLSKPVVRTGITLLAPKPQLAGGWLVPLFSFTSDMWIAVALSFLLCSLALFCIDVFRRTKYNYKKLKHPKKKIALFQNSVLNTAALFLLQTLTEEKKELADLAKKCFYGCMFLFSILMASGYSSGLASSMTVPRYFGAIKTVSDLLESDVHWGATSIAWIMSIMDSPEPTYVSIVKKFWKADGDRLSAMNHKRFAFSIERLPNGYFAIGEYITEEGASDLRLMTEDLYWEQCVLMTRKSSVWMPALDDLILMLAQTGVQSTWERRVATTHMNANIQRQVSFYSHHSEDSDSVPVKLTWSHVSGAFGVLMIGGVLGFCSFLYENIGHRMRHRKPKNC